MSGHDIVVIGASAGGVEAVSQLVKHLPTDLPAALFVVLHFPPYSVSLLPQILNRMGSLPASHPKDGEDIRAGRIYVAPPDFHLIVRPNYVHLSRGPREHGHRPAIDTLFRSAARSYRQRVVGVILSGTLDDGTIGLASIKALRGVALVQDPGEALFDSMCRSAIERVRVDHILKITGIAAMLEQLAYSPVEEEEAMQPDGLQFESEIVATNKAALEQGENSGSASMLTCPDCGGVLWEIQNGDLVRYRCHVGHVYSIDSLLTHQAEDTERALWSSVRALEEKAALSRRMAAQARRQNRRASEAQFIKRAQEAEQNAALVRRVILQQTDQPHTSSNSDIANSQ